MRVRALAKRRVTIAGSALCRFDHEPRRSKTVERDGQALKLSPIGWRLLEILLRIPRCYRAVR